MAECTFQAGDKVRIKKGAERTDPFASRVARTCGIFLTVEVTGFRGEVCVKGRNGKTDMAPLDCLEPAPEEPD